MNSNGSRAETSTIELRYGTNPHQRPATARSVSGSELPFDVLNGAPSAINLLDAMLAWQLVRELEEGVGEVAAASFKHLSPTGAAVSAPLPPDLAESYQVESEGLSPTATAYARARGADRVSAFGDCAAFSSNVDESAARLLEHEVSDVVIAPAYEPAALEVLRRKKRGNYLILRAKPNQGVGAPERRELYGLTIEQPENDVRITTEQLLAGVVTRDRGLDRESLRDLLIATIALKYTQSNSVTVAVEGQLVGVGCGQQSRIQSVRTALTKAQLWHLRRHAVVRGLPLRNDISRPDRDNAIDLYLRQDMTPPERRVWRRAFTTEPEAFDEEGAAQWQRTLGRLALSSDGLIPFRDTIDRAAAAGVQYVAQPGGSIRDEEVIEAADEYGMVMTCTGVRLFTH